MRGFASAIVAAFAISANAVQLQSEFGFDFDMDMPSFGGGDFSSGLSVLDLGLDDLQSITSGGSLVGQLNNLGGLLKEPIKEDEDEEEEDEEDKEDEDEAEDEDEEEEEEDEEEEMPEDLPGLDLDKLKAALGGLANIRSEIDLGAKSSDFDTSLGSVGADLSKGLKMDGGLINAPVLPDFMSGALGNLGGHDIPKPEVTSIPLPEAKEGFVLQMNLDLDEGFLNFINIPKFGGVAQDDEEDEDEE